MSNSLAIILASVIVVALLLDQFFNSGDATLFMIRKLVDLVEELAFWR